MWTKTFCIQHTVECMDHFGEISWVEGIVAFINPEIFSKDKLKDFSKEMIQHFDKKRWRISGSRLTSIFILEGDKMHILYSDRNPKTDVKHICDILDTVPAPEKWVLEDDLIIYRDDFEPLDVDVEN